MQSQLDQPYAAIIDIPDTEAIFKWLCWRNNVDLSGAVYNPITEKSKAILYQAAEQMKVAGQMLILANEIYREQSQ